SSHPAIQSSSYPAIHLHKIIPMGAGLGGGSSNGACTIKMLNDLYNLDLPVLKLMDLARQLGSDCSFFIESKPAFATGKGDQLEPIDLDLSGYQIVIVVPPVHMSTPKAYSMVKPQKPVLSIRETIRLPVEQWKSRLINDFEEPVMNRHPVIREIKEELYNHGAIYAAMSGSGAAVFGIFNLQSPVPSLQIDSSFKAFFI
ncbi:MAG: 4-(cytidine 5'-diphospho)-2-C-methyl-D-erythritol kinase, partial [Bacteroidia bacterium]|nr:4-(cytidine 5'-diphospho)-2-C-methyl-D-erythritol kinase [Bacteroidia bacterium]